MHAEDPVGAAALDFLEEEEATPSGCERAVSLFSSLRISADMVDVVKWEMEDEIRMDMRCFAGG